MKDLLKYLSKLSPIKIFSIVSVLSVDLFSTVQFFLLQGTSWVLPTIALVFVFVKVDHWRKIFTEPTKLRRNLRITTWLTLSVISVWAFLTMGLAITQGTKSDLEVVQERTQVATASAVLNKVESLNRDRAFQESLRNNALEKQSSLERYDRTAFNTYAEEIRKITAEINRIDEEVLRLTMPAAEGVTSSIAEKPWWYVNPIGVKELLATVFPEEWVDLATRLLYLLTGIALELTLALGAMPDKKKEEETVEQPLVLESATFTASKASVEERLSSIGENTSVIEDSGVVFSNEDVPMPIHVNDVVPSKPDIDKLLAYVDAIYIEEGKRLLSDELVVQKFDFTMEEAQSLRKHLASTFYKKIPLIRSAKGGTWATVSKLDMKRLCKLYDNVEYKSGT